MGSFPWPGFLTFLGLACLLLLIGAAIVVVVILVAQRNRKRESDPPVPPRPAVPPGQAQPPSVAPSMPTSRTCSACGTVNELANNFCEQCGSPLS